MDIIARPLNYDTKAVSEEQYEQHYKLYEGYVNKVNSITNDLKTGPHGNDANAVYSLYRGLKSGETFAIDGVILHEAYFQNMTTEKTEPSERIQAVFLANFGSFKNWRDDFVACCKAARGWCMLVYEQRTRSYRNILLDAHNYGDICGAYPLIVMDMYEHAYFMDYGIDKVSYIENFMASIDWNVVENRLAVVN